MVAGVCRSAESVAFPSAECSAVADGFEKRKPELLQDCYQKRTHPLYSDANSGWMKNSSLKLDWMHNYPHAPCSADCLMPGIA